MPTVTIPVGELKPDQQSFANDGLVEAKNVVPIHGNYIASQLWTTQGDRPSTEPYGLHRHYSGGSTWYAYLGSVDKIYQANTSLVPIWLLVDKTRLAGAYNTSAAGGENGWQGASFGDAIIMTNFVDDPQILTSPAAANFVKLAQSGGANPGMDPRAKFVFPFKLNLFLANLNLAAPFDGLAAGDNPTVVCWSQNNNARQFGSVNVTPQLTGTDYQPLSYDFGHITGTLGGGEYAIITFQGGIARIDGPPYTFRPIINGYGCRFPNSITRFGDDVYLWTVSGPARLRGGEGPIEILGSEKFRRTLIDNNTVTGFSPTYSIASDVINRHVSVGRDLANDCIWWSYTSISRAQDGGFTQYGNMSFVYNVGDGRCAFCENGYGIIFLQERPDLSTTWSPGRDLFGIAVSDGLPGIGVGANLYGLAVPDYGSAGAALPSLKRAFHQLDKEQSNRVVRVRPIYSRTSSVGTVTVTLTVGTKVSPNSTPVVRSSTSTDTHGWFIFPDTVFGDWHQFGMSVDGVRTDTIIEIEAFEVEFVYGSQYAA